MILWCIHLYLQKQQAQRYRTAFATRIAETVRINRSSRRSLTPDALLSEFKRIDADVEDGKLSQEELWQFLSDGKAGEMSRNDFDALFAAMDLDKNGSVDFLEFCAFMGQCHDEYAKERSRPRVERSMSVARSLRKLQVDNDGNADDESR